MANIDREPTEHPGRTLLREIQARDWTQREMSYVLGWQPSQLNDLIKGRGGITAKSSKMMGIALALPESYFLNLQKIFDLSETQQPDPLIQERAQALVRVKARGLCSKELIST